MPAGFLLNVRPRISEDGSEISMLIDYRPVSGYRAESGFARD
jgi:hypothetical protein